MAANTTTCSNCGTENPPRQDFCVKCKQPLTGSADEGLRENLDAQDSGSFFGTGGTTARGSEFDAGMVGGTGTIGGTGGQLTPLDPDQGLTDVGSPDQPGRSEGLPPRRS